MTNEQAKQKRAEQKAALIKAAHDLHDLGIDVKVLGKSIVRVRDGRMVEELGEVAGEAEALVALRWFRRGLEVTK